MPWTHPIASVNINACVQENFHDVGVAVARSVDKCTDTFLRLQKYVENA